MKKLTLTLVAIISIVGIIVLIWRKSPKTRSVIKSSPRVAKNVALRVWEWKE